MDQMHLTSEQGRARNPLEQLAQHVWANRLVWYVALIVMLSIGLMLGGVRRG